MLVNAAQQDHRANRTGRIGLPGRPTCHRRHQSIVSFHGHALQAAHLAVKAIGVIRRIRFIARRDQPAQVIVGMAPIGPAGPIDLINILQIIKPNHRPPRLKPAGFSAVGLSGPAPHSSQWISWIFCPG